VRSRKPIRHRAALVLLLPLLLGSATTTPPRSGLAAGPLPGHSDRASLAYAEAAAAVRRKDCNGAYKALTPILSGRDSEAAFSQLLLGFYASSCQQTAYAEERLFAAKDPDGPLEDWRLLLLSDAAAARGHVLLAQTSLARLLGDYPGSALRPRALIKAATLAWQRGDTRRALDLVEAARSEELRGDDGAQLEALAWQIGLQTANREVQAEAARHLLVSFPLKASELNAIEIFRAPDGSLSWARILTGDQLKRRARTLLDLKLEGNALTTLESVSLPDRDLDWQLLEAQTLTRLHRGSDALSLLAGRQAPNARQAAALAWTWAQAADDAATAQRGRANLGSAERQQLRELTQQYLEKVGQIRPTGSSTAPSTPCAGCAASIPRTPPAPPTSGRWGGRSTAGGATRGRSAPGPSSIRSTRRTPTPAGAATGRRAPSTSWARPSGRSRSTTRSPRPTRRTSTAATPWPACAPSRRRWPPRRRPGSPGPRTPPSTGRGC
jgi:hypothetical protein